MATLPPSWFKFDSDYTDSGSNGFNGAAAGTGNSFDTTNKQQGTASLLTNGSGYATFGDNIDLLGNDACTWSFWFKTSTGATMTLLSKCSDWGPHTNKGWNIAYLHTNTSIYLQMNAGTSFQANELQTRWNTGSLAGGAWHHLVITKTTGNTTAALTFYLNNSTVGITSTDSDTLTAGGDMGTASELTVAAQGDGNGKYTGNIDSVKILKGIVWSSTDVSDEYNNPNQTYGSVNANFLAFM